MDGTRAQPTWGGGAALGTHTPVRTMGTSSFVWHQRRWAEWLGAVSGSVYIPIEMYELMHGISWPKVMVLSVNLACVFYLVAALRSHGNKRPD